MLADVKEEKNEKTNACNSTIGNHHIFLLLCRKRRKKESKTVLLYTHSGHYKMTPAPTLHSDSFRIKIEKVELVKDAKNNIFTKITYRPWYGKISAKSFEFRKKHETQLISFLARGDCTGKVKKDEILRMCFYPN